MNDNPEDSGLFAGADSADEVLAIILDQYGPECLAEFLTMVVKSGYATREMLELASEKLADAGLSEAAEMVYDAAGDLPHKSQQNPFDPTTERALHIDWNRRELGDYTGYLCSDAERIAKGKAMGYVK